jgi:hypothetical protein
LLEIQFGYVVDQFFSFNPRAGGAEFNLARQRESVTHPKHFTVNKLIYMPWCLINHVRLLSRCRYFLSSYVKCSWERPGPLGPGVFSSRILLGLKFICCNDTL